MRLSPFETYCLFQALKLHFTTESYDFFKYGGKTKSTVDQFNSKRDRFFYHRLCRRYDKDQIKDFIVANMLGRDKSWVGDLLDDDADEQFTQYIKQKQSLTYRFKNELEKVFTEHENPFKFEDNGYPALINDYMRGDISFDTALIINDFTNCFSKFDKKLKGDFLWDKFYFKAKKFRPFLEYDKNKIAGIIKEQINVTK